MCPALVCIALAPVSSFVGRVTALLSTSERFFGSLNLGPSQHYNVRLPRSLLAPIRSSPAWGRTGFMHGAESIRLNAWGRFVASWGRFVASSPPRVTVLKTHTNARRVSLLGPLLPFSPMCTHHTRCLNLPLPPSPVNAVHNLAPPTPTQNIWEEDAESIEHTAFGAESVKNVLARTISLVEVRPRRCPPRCSLRPMAEDKPVLLSFPPLSPHHRKLRRPAKERASCW